MKLVPFIVVLRSDEKALIREVVPSDAELLKSGFDHLSDQSRHFRFLAAHPKLLPSEVRRFTARNDTDHVAIGAILTGGPSDIPLAIGRYIRLTEGGTTAEFAITVVDSHQGLGLGSLILGALAKHAIGNNISEFFGLVHEENAAMLSLLDQLGGYRAKSNGSEIDVRIALQSDPAKYPETPVGDAFRTAYRLARIT